MIIYLLSVAVRPNPTAVTNPSGLHAFSQEHGRGTGWTRLVGRTLYGNFSKRISPVCSLRGAERLIRKKIIHSFLNRYMQYLSFLFVLCVLTISQLTGHDTHSTYFTMLYVLSTIVFHKMESSRMFIMYVHTFRMTVWVKF